MREWIVRKVRLFLEREIVNATHLKGGSGWGLDDIRIGPQVSEWRGL